MLLIQGVFGLEEWNVRLEQCHVGSYETENTLNGSCKEIDLLWTFAINQHDCISGSSSIGTMLDLKLLSDPRIKKGWGFNLQRAQENQICINVSNKHLWPLV